MCAEIYEHHGVCGQQLAIVPHNNARAVICIATPVAMAN